MRGKPTRPVVGRRFAGLGRRLGLIAAVWAVTGQIAFGGMMLVETTRTLLGARNFICHVAAGGGAPASPRHGADCDTCPLCQALVETAAIAAPAAAAPEVPPPPLAWQRQGGVLPPSRAPPAFALATPWPRGPPA